MVLQFDLNDWLRKHHLPAIDDDYIFGPRTEWAVRQFQRHNGLIVDGVVGPQTYRKMHRCYFP